MKKILVVIFMLALIPTAAMSAGLEFQLGGTAFYNNLLTPADADHPITVSWDDFTYGVDARINWGILQVSAIALITPPAYVDNGWVYYGGSWTYEAYAEPMLIDLFVSIGLKFDIAIFSFGFGLGPNFLFKIWPEEFSAYYYEDTTEVFDMGGHVKLFADLNLGRLTVSVQFIMMVNTLNLAQISSALEAMEGYLGVSLLYKM